MDSQLETIEPEALADVEDTLESHLNRLAGLETITKEDLNDFRKDLPTDPVLAEIVQLALPYPWSELFEYVEASEHQSAHWRTSHDRSAIRSAADLEHKLRFAEAAREARGLEGTVERNGREIPASAAHVADAVSGESSEKSDTNTAGARALDRLRELLGG